MRTDVKEPKPANVERLYRKAQFAKKLRKVVRGMEWLGDNLLPVVVALVVVGGGLFVIGFILLQLWLLGWGWVPIIVVSAGLIFLSYHIMDWWSEKTLDQARKERVWD